MIVKLKKKNARYRDLTFGQPYVVIGIEADELRILNDVGRPFLFPPKLFSIDRILFSFGNIGANELLVRFPELARSFG